MRRFLMCTLLVAGLWQGAPAHGGDDEYPGIFYGSLDPHGEWIFVDHGVYAWRPLGIHAGWRPYTVGRWMWTSYGWYWVSAEPWGWATYHYGRWFYDDFYGWVWIPGSEWAPAWVEWRYGGGMVGWAPLPPYAVFSVSVGVTFSTAWVTPYAWWSFVDCRYMGAPSVHRYVYRPRYNERYIGRTRGVGSVRHHEGTIRSAGPDRGEVERSGRIRMPDAEVVEGRDARERVATRGGATRLEVYRPRIEERGDRASVRPGRIRDGRVGIDAGALRPDARRVERRDTERAPAVREDISRRREGERSGRETQMIDPRRIERRDAARGPETRERIERGDPEKRPEGRDSREQRVRRPEEKSPPPGGRAERESVGRSRPEGRPKR